MDTKVCWTQKDIGHKRILDTKGYWTQRILDTKDTGHKRILDTKDTGHNRILDTKDTGHKNKAIIAKYLLFNILKILQVQGTALDWGSSCQRE